jgi:type I restriction-modification system DNA methylase subunit
MTVAKEEAKSRLTLLVQRYEAVRNEIIASTSDYNETQLRNDFLNEFLRLLGWDVDNRLGLPQHLREVAHEAHVKVQIEQNMRSKTPDYALCVGGARKLFIEAKKPSVKIEVAKEPAFQLRRYGWNAQLTISVLSNFEKLAIYDCRYPPNAEDPATVTRILLVDYTEYIARFDELHALLSRDSVFGGSIERLIPTTTAAANKQMFDNYFLNQIETWRELLAHDLVANNTRLDQEVLNFLVQRVLNRIIFLRICEDRSQENYERLKGVTTYTELKKLFLEADQRYDSALFDFIDDQLSLGIIISAEVLVTIFSALYYPNSPYDFSVIDSSILGEIYELFLARQIVLNVNGSIQVVEKPEIIASNGVVSTPKYIVDEIVQRTLAPLCKNLSPLALKDLRVCDISCGSGVFLLAVYEYLVNHYREWYIANEPQDFPGKVYTMDGYTWHLTLAEKHTILLVHIYGVDNDPQAVEVAKFSLLLKILEGETASTIAAFNRTGRKALPNLKENIKSGNSLVDARLFDFVAASQTSEMLVQINPFDWQQEFPQVMLSGGFDAIVGNPPYVRIQNMVQYSPIEVDYYRHNKTVFKTAGQDNFDKYYLFIERGLQLLKQSGYLGYIIPNKFLTIQSGQQLRKLLSQERNLLNLVHFGVEQIFPNRSTYTAILVLSKTATAEFTVDRISDLSTWRVTKQCVTVTYRSSDIGKEPWVFVAAQMQNVFAKMLAVEHQTLEKVADIFVGLQTSADKIYIITPDEMLTRGNTVTFTKANRRWEIETAILKACLYDTALQPFSQVDANALIIFPYQIQNGIAKLYSPDDMQKFFPLCWEYLNYYRPELERRSISGGIEQQWYQYGRSQSLAQFNNEEKLIWPVLSLTAPYAYDGQNVFFTGGGNGPYYALRPKDPNATSIYYLLAVVSHPAIEAMLKVRSSSFRGGYYSHGKQFIRNLPIKQIDFTKSNEQTLYHQIVDNVKKLILVKQDLAGKVVPNRRRVLQTQSVALQTRITQAVTDLYGLTQEDLEAIQSNRLYFAEPTEE